MGILSEESVNGLMADTNYYRLRLIHELRAVGERHQQRRSGGEAWNVAFAPDNSYFAWSCGHGRVGLLPWKVDENNPNDDDAPHSSNDQDFKYDRQLYPVVINCGDIVWSLAFGLSNRSHRNDAFNRRHYYNFSPPTGQTMVLAVGLNNGRIKIFTPNGKLITELIDHRDVVRDLKFSPDGKLILMSASRDSSLKLWDLKDDGNMFQTLKHSDSEWVMCCAWSPDAQWTASGGSGKEVYIWRASDWSLRHKLSGHLHNVTSVQFSPDGGLLASCSYDTSIILWEYMKGEIITIIWHMIPPPRLIFASGDNEHFVRQVSFSTDGQHLASVCDDGYVRIWNVYCNNGPVEMVQVQNALCTTYSNDGRYLAVGTRDGAAHVYTAPVLVRSLGHICRSVIRQFAGASVVDRLGIPQVMKAFLLYKDLPPFSNRKRPVSDCSEN